MHQIQAIGECSDKPEGFSQTRESCNDSSHADDCKKATGAGGEIDEDVGVTVAVKLERRGIKEHTDHQTSPAEEKAFCPRGRLVVQHSQSHTQSEFRQTTNRKSALYPH